MKKLTTAILISAITLSTVSCKKEIIGEGPVLTKTRVVQPFNGIDLRMNGNVYYTKSSHRKIEITAKESIHSMLETTVANNKLVIRYHDGKTYDLDESIRINVWAPDLASLTLTTSGNIFVMNDIQPASLFVRTEGSGCIGLQDITSFAIEAESTGSGSITATGGITVSEKLKSDASGRIDFSGIIAKTVTTHTIGSGDISVKVVDNLNATISGSGYVYFSGYPNISSHISGTGRLVRL